MQIGMSRKGNPYDNPIVESFFKTLKSEEVYVMDVGSFDELRLRLPEYIDVVYNTNRLHWSLSYPRPAEFEAMRTFTTTPRRQHEVTCGFSLAPHWSSPARGTIRRPEFKQTDSLNLFSQKRKALMGL